MPRKTLLLFVLGAGAVALSGILLGSADDPGGGIRLVFTEVPARTAVPGDGPVDWRYPDQSRLMALDLDHPERPPVALTEGFQAARAPAVSFDGQHILFSGKKEAGDAWQIWEMRTDGSALRPVTEGLPGATDPAYLPHDAVIFSGRLSETDDLHALFTVNRDGTDLQRITFHPESDGAPALLRDGRVVVASGPEAEDAKVLYGMRYDGTGAELLYRTAPAGRLHAGVRETEDRHLVFVESGADDSVGGDLVTVSLARPLHTRADLVPEEDGHFHSVAVGPVDTYTVSYRAEDADVFALYAFSPTERRLGERLYGDPARHAVEPVPAVARTEPMGFVSIVDAQVEAGWLYCLNAEHSSRPPEESAGRGERVRVHGIDGLLGEVPLEADGSFYVEIPPDTPLRFQTIDAAGVPVRGPSSWIWVRPNEQRGCIGCHEDRELAPENRVPAAVTRPPVPLLPSRTLAERTGAAPEPTDDRRPLDKTP